MKEKKGFKFKGLFISLLWGVVGFLALFGLFVWVMCWTLDYCSIVQTIQPQEEQEDLSSVDLTRKEYVACFEGCCQGLENKTCWLDSLEEMARLETREKCYNLCQKEYYGG